MSTNVMPYDSMCFFGSISTPKDFPEYRKIEKFVPEPEDKIDEVLEDLDKYLDQDLMEWESCLEEHDGDDDGDDDAADEVCDQSDGSAVSRLVDKKAALQSEGSTPSGSNLEGNKTALQSEGSTPSGSHPSGGSDSSSSGKPSCLASQSSITSDTATIRSDSSVISGESDKHSTLQSLASIVSGQVWFSLRFMRCAVNLLLVL